MDILDLTNYDNIRSLLGVNSKEIADETIALEVYSQGMTMEFEDMDFGMLPKYQEVEAINESDRTAEQTRFYMTARSFAAYAVAKELCTSLPLFAPKEVSDSKTLVGRFASNPYKDTISQVREHFGILRTRLIAAFGVVQASDVVATSRVFLAVSGLTTDPVTGE
jgi:hypothetical protein